MYTKNMSKKYLDSKGLSYLWQKIKKEMSLNPGPQGEQGSVLYNASTYSDYITNGYESSMRVNDLILDNGESVYSRRGNVYRIVDINDDTTGEFETNEIYAETQFNDIPEGKKFIIVSKVENKDKSGYTYWALSNARSSSSDCAAIQLSNDDIHEKENVVYLDKNLSNSVDINSLFFKVQRDPVYSGVTYTGKSRIIAVNANYSEENEKNWDCLYFSSASSTNTTRLNTISGTRNAVFEIDNNTGYPHPYLLGTKYLSSDPNTVDGLTKYLGAFDEENAPESVSKFRCYKNINSSLDKQQLIFLVEDNVSIYNPTRPKVVIETEPVTNLIGSKGEPGKDADVPYIGSNGNWFIAGVDTGIKAQGEDGKQGENGLTLISTITSVDELHNIATTDELHINDAYILDPNYDYTTHTPEYRKGALWVFRGEKIEDAENKITEETSAGIFEYVCNLQGQKGIDGTDGATGPQGEKGTGSLSYIVATCDEHVIAKYYNENMCIGDLVIDNGEVDEGRRGNMYRIINIIENPDFSKYNTQYPPSNPAIIIDKNIVCNLKGDTINGKYLFDYILNSYSFGYQREIIENIKVRRLKDNEKYLLSEIYGVNWEYINLDNKIQEGAKGKIYSDEVNYIDKISDIKYVDLSIGGTLFNCETEIIPENDYTIYDFTYKYLSGVEGTNAFAEGDATLAEGNSAHAEGEWNTAYGDYSHAEGESTTAQGQASHAEGEDTLAIGDASHTEGSRTLAVGDYSHAEGFDTVAQNAYEHAQGAYNVSNKESDTFGDKNTIFSIGIGKSGLNRRNAIEVLQNGDVYIKGVGEYDGKTLSNSKSLQKILGSGDLGDSIKRIEVSDISKFYYGFEDLSFYGLKPEDVDKLLDNKGEIEITVNLLPLFMNLIAGHDILGPTKNDFPQNLLFKISPKTKFSTSECELQRLPSTAEELFALCECISYQFDNFGEIASQNELFTTSFACNQYHQNGCAIGALSNTHKIFFDWVTSQLYLPFYNFEIPKCFINTKIRAKNVFDLNLNTSFLVSDSKIGIATLYDDVETFKGFSNTIIGSGATGSTGNSDSSGSSNPTSSLLSSIEMGKFIDAVKTLGIISMRCYMMENLLNNVQTNNQITNLYEALYYVIEQYVNVLYPTEMTEYVNKLGFSSKEEYLETVGFALEIILATLENGYNVINPNIDPSDIASLSKTGMFVNENVPLFLPEHGLSNIEPMILVHLCNIIVYDNRMIIQEVEE